MSQHSILDAISSYLPWPHKSEGDPSTDSHGRRKDWGKRKHKDDGARELEYKTGRAGYPRQTFVEEQAQYIRVIERQLKETEELLAARTAELSGTNAFLSTTDQLSEEDVLSIVRDLNESIFQVAVRLTEEWEKLEFVPATSSMDVDPSPVDVDPHPQPRISALVEQVRNRVPTGLTFLLQSCLCSQVVAMTSSWGRHQELTILESVYGRLSASEGQSISARWRSLTHRYLSRPSPDPALLLEELANILRETGSFPSTQQSLEFVRTPETLEGIASIIRLAQRLESAFMLEVTSSDMSLLFEAPGTAFDNTRMTNEFGSGGSQDEVAGTIEVGVGKSIGARPGEDRRVEILLGANVVLERDIQSMTSVDEPRQVESEQAKSEQAKLEQTKQAKLEQVELEQVEPEQVEPEQVELEQVELEQVKLERVESLDGNSSGEFVTVEPALAEFA